MGFRVITLGRPAVFYMPLEKLYRQHPDAGTFKNLLENFLREQYGAFTLEGGENLGAWSDPSGKVHYDRCYKYRVAFVGKERIPELQAFLAELARSLEELAVYLETGEDAWIIEPLPG